MQDAGRILSGNFGMRQEIQYFDNSKKSVKDMIANAPWYVPSITLHEDLNVPLVKEVMKQSTGYHNKIEGHVNSY
jgi:hypothetical protein